MPKADTNSVRPLFAQWKHEHADLNRRVEEFRNWTDAVAQLGVPKFGEAACLLKQLRSRMLVHFDREQEISRQLTEAYPKNSVEVTASCKHAAQDHQQLLAELDDLIARLSELDPQFESWQSAMIEVSLFIDRLDEHEEYEREHIEWLAPPE